MTGAIIERFQYHLLCTSGLYSIDTKQGSTERMSSSVCCSGKECALNRNRVMTASLVYIAYRLKLPSLYILTSKQLSTNPFWTLLHSHLLFWYVYTRYCFLQIGQIADAHCEYTSYKLNISEKLDSQIADAHYEFST